MTLIKSLLLGSAAGIVAVASAQAADLPTKKAAPAAEYVKVCTVGGITGFVLPGSDTCMKISGYLTGQMEGGNLKDQYILVRSGTGKPAVTEGGERQSPSPTSRPRSSAADDRLLDSWSGQLRRGLQHGLRPVGRPHRIAGQLGRRLRPARQWRRHQLRLPDLGRPHRRQARLVLRLLRRRPVVEGLRVARPQRHADQPVGLHRLVRRRLRGDPLARTA